MKSTVAGLELDPTVTTTGPVPGGAVVGTSATICKLLQLVIEVAAVLLKVTVLAPLCSTKARARDCYRGADSSEARRNTGNHRTGSNGHRNIVKRGLWRALCCPGCIRLVPRRHFEPS